MKKNSTGALTKQQKEMQDKRYLDNNNLNNYNKNNNHYDYIIIGTGSSALTVSALLANAGHKICMLEAHDIAGGYAHSFTMGKFSFCAQIHYIWDCGKGGKIYEFLKRIGLEKDITFELYDQKGYDVIALPDGNKIKIPYGFDKLIENIIQAYPNQEKPIKKFVKIMETVRRESQQFTLDIPNWKYIYLFPTFLKFLNLFKYRNKTLQDVFDECNLSIETQTILAGNSGDFGSPPNELSFIIYISLFSGYNTGAYYPTKHFKHYVQRLVDFILERKGCDIYYETPVNKIIIDEITGKVTAIETLDGKKFTADTFICNADPQIAAQKLIGWEKFSKQYQKKLSYTYSPSGIMIYLGLKDIDLIKYGFGKHNLWHMEEFGLNKMWEKQREGNFSKPWFFISTPTLHSKAAGTAPKGCEIMEIATLVDYEMFKTLQDKDYKEYNHKKMALAEHLLDMIEEKYIPNLRKHIITKVIGSPTTNEDYVLSPYGSAYGALMSPNQIGLHRLGLKTPWKNLYWCNQSAGYSGIYGTVSTGIQLYTMLTGDDFLKRTKFLSDEKKIELLKH